MIALIASLSLLAGLALRTLTSVSFLCLDNNDLAHFFGAFGLVNLVVLSLSNEVPRRQANGGLLALVALSIASYAAAVRFAPWVWQFNVPYWAVAWQFLPLVPLFAVFLRGLDALSKVTGRSPYAPLRTADVIGIPVCFSLWWELVIQPNFDVYGAAARGHVQWSQFLADQLACLLVWMLWLGVRRVDSRTSKRISPMPN